MSYRCRSCTSFASWAAMTKGQTPKESAPKSESEMAGSTSLPANCPPDVDALGRSTWNMLHTMTATYPEQPSRGEQDQARSFISLFSNVYPCGHCAEDFRNWMDEGNQPAVGSRSDFGRWMCNAHNAVNEKLGKESFDCSKWEERWRTGPPDGRCG